MTVALGGDGADELFAGYPNFSVQPFAPAMRFVPAVLGRTVGRAIQALPRADGYMNRWFLLGQLSHGFGAPTGRQSFLWMAPLAADRLSRLWRRSALPEEAFIGAFASIDHYTANAAGLAPIDLLLYLFLVSYLPEDILTKTDPAAM